MQLWGSCAREETHESKLQRHAAAPKTVFTRFCRRDRPLAAYLTDGSRKQHAQQKRLLAADLEKKKAQVMQVMPAA